MTILDCKKSEKEFLSVADVSKILNCRPQNLRLQARLKPESLGFPCVVIGSRVKFPRVAFIRFCEGEAQ